MKIIMCVCAYVYEGGRKGRGRRVDTSFFFFFWVDLRERIITGKGIILEG